LSGNKILAPLGGHPLLWWTLRALTNPEAWPTDAELDVIVAGRPDEFAAITACAPPAVPFRVVEGGASRQASVGNAASAACGELLVVHDAARPNPSPALITGVCRAAMASGAAIAALPAADTVKVVNAQAVIQSTLDRRALWLAQTPQAFHRELFLRALHEAERDGFEGTDCASLVERLHPVQVVNGEATNIKVTYAEDLRRVADALGMEC
jgi:2-C-methyl-D-erythritol 4-phosphate cytidylyltransferase